jgi:hypothetical protein
MFRTRITSASLAVLLASCAHAPVEFKGEPREALAQVCSPGAQLKSARGSVFLKAKSKEASGQFPAEVDAPGPDRLKIEITNLVGGTEAIISVEGTHYTINVPKQKNRSEKGERSWGGIPLQWSNALFLGRIPCPPTASLSGTGVTVNKEGDVVAETTRTLEAPAEKFVYHTRQVADLLWPETLHWEKLDSAGGVAVAVDFKFDEPEAGSRSPRKWEAKSSQGEVKVRWRERTTQ